jgi:hypothetical protein
MRSGNSTQTCHLCETQGLTHTMLNTQRKCTTCCDVRSLNQQAFAVPPTSDGDATCRQLQCALGKEQLLPCKAAKEPCLALLTATWARPLLRENHNTSNPQRLTLSAAAALALGGLNSQLAAAKSRPVERHTQEYPATRRIVVQVTWPPLIMRWSANRAVKGL